MGRHFAMVLLVFLVGLAGPCDDLVAQASEEGKIVCRISVDPRVELMSVLYRLVGAPEYNQARIDAYSRAVDAHFSPYREHEAVQMARKLRAERGISHDAPMSLAVHMTEGFDFRERVPLEPLPTGLDSRWRPDEARAFIAAAKRFAEVSKFREFFESQQPLFGQAVERMQRTMIRHGRVAWLDRFFGAAGSASYHVYLGMLNGSGCYGVTFVEGDQREIGCVLGVWEQDPRGLPRFPETAISTLMYLFAHSHVAPVMERHTAELEQPAMRMLRQEQACLRKPLGGRWRNVMHRSLLAAFLVRYRLANEGDLAATREVTRQKIHGLSWVGDLAEAMGEYEDHRDQYPDLEAFMPRIVGFFEAYSREIASRQRPNGAVEHVHDPSIIREGDWYYVFSTDQGIAVRRSKDLVFWESAGKVFDSVPTWATQAVPGASNVWAPDISRVEGGYRLYYAVSTFGSNRSVIGLATAQTLDPQDPAHGWVDQGMVLQSREERNGFNAVDPCVVVDREGKAWLFFGSFWSGIHAVALDAKTGKLEEDSRTIAIARRPRASAIEAPFVVHRDGWYYLFVSFDQSANGVDSTYKIMVGRSKRITGPYVDRAGESMLRGGGTLMLASYGQWRGPGHNAVLRDGASDWLVHHTYDAENSTVPTLQVRPLLWADDGWPLAGEPWAGEAPPAEPVESKDLEGIWAHSIDFGPVSQIGLLANGQIAGPVPNALWSLKGAKLTLRWPSPQAPGGVWLEKCFISPDGQSYVGRDQSHRVVRGTKLD
jgi:arabinan endo-1,5-alpha-L-arabinosidase